MKNMALWVFFLIAFISCTQNNEREQDTSKKYDSTNVEIVANDFSITQKDSVFPSSSQIEIFDERLNYDTISLKK